jgi:hypothetical protein
MSLINKIATFGMFIAGLLLALALGDWIFSTGSVNVVDLSGCVTNEYKPYKGEIIKAMRAQSWSDEMISQSFDCY